MAGKETALYCERGAAGRGEIALPPVIMNSQKGINFSREEKGRRCFVPKKDDEIDGLLICVLLAKRDANNIKCGRRSCLREK